MTGCDTIGFRAHAAALAAALALAAGLWACASGSGPGVEGPEAQALFAHYTGTWQLNREESETLREKLAEATRERRGRGGFGMPGGRGMPPGGGRTGGRSGGRGGPGGPGGDPAQVRRVIDRLLGEAERFELQVTDSTITVTPGDRSPTEVRLDGKTETRDLGFAEVELKGEWKDRNVRVERRVKDRGPAVQETYEVVENGARLIVTRSVELGFGGRRVEVVQVYDRTEAPS